MTKLFVRLFVKNYKDTSDIKVRTSYGKLAGTIGIITNALLFTVKLVIGILSNSLSIIADSVNNLTDSASSIVSIIGFKLSSKPADKEHPYGHGRYEYLAGLCVAIIIAVLGIELFKSSITKIMNPQKIVFNLYLVCVLCASIIIKLWLMWFNKAIAKMINSSVLHAASADSRNDVLATLVVLVGIVAEHFFGFEIDGWLGLGVSCFILASGIKLIKDTIDPVIGPAPNEALAAVIKEKILSYPNILGVHDLIVHDYGPNRKFASVHVEMPGEDDAIKSHKIIDEIERDMLVGEGIHLIVHFDPVITGDIYADSVESKIIKILKEIDPQLTIHDLLATPLPDGYEIHFDCVVPKEFEKNDEEIIDIISKKVSQTEASWKVYITIDRSFISIIK